MTEVQNCFDEADVEFLPRVRHWQFCVLSFHLPPIGP